MTRQAAMACGSTPGSPARAAVRVLVAVAAAAAAGCAGAQRPQSPPLDACAQPGQDAEAIWRCHSGSVASIEARAFVFTGEGQSVQEGKGTGSGFVVAPSVVATNLHVVRRARGVKVRLVGSQEALEADRILAINFEHDLALLRVPGARTAPLRLAPAGDARIGRRVYAIGDTLNTSQSITDGVINARLDPHGYLRHSAMVGPGNSGGPLLLDDGRVVAINTGVIVHPQAGVLPIAVPADYLPPGGAGSAPCDESPEARYRLDGANVMARLHLEGATRVPVCLEPGDHTNQAVAVIPLPGGFDYVFVAPDVEAPGSFAVVNVMAGENIVAVPTSLEAPPMLTLPVPHELAVFLKNPYDTRRCFRFELHRVIW